MIWNTSIWQNKPQLTVLCCCFFHEILSSYIDLLEVLNTVIISLLLYLNLPSFMNFNFSKISYKTKHDRTDLGCYVMVRCCHHFLILWKRHWWLWEVKAYIFEYIYIYLVHILGISSHQKVARKNNLSIKHWSFCDTTGWITCCVWTL